LKDDSPGGTVLAMIKPIQDFLKLESAGGILLMAAAALAMILANSPLAGVYGLLIDLPVEIRIGPFEIAKPLLLWINDGLMAVFFFLVGLELKREALEGELSDPRVASLPAVGAAGGMIAPAAIYVFVNWGDPVALNGWAIPSATDIAFALGILLLLGRRVPTPLKVFLVSLAIFDDLGAILIIALFYSADLSFNALLTALACLIPLWILNRRNVTDLVPYVLIGLVLWAALLKSGVHATLAGVVLAFFIPLRDKGNPARSPLRELEHDLHTAVAFGILPLFAFANSGMALRAFDTEFLLHPVTLGIAAGLFIGKQLGVFGFCWLAIKSGIAKMPPGTSWAALYGVSLLCGIGFTMSFFIGSLSFEHAKADHLFDERLGIIVGSLLSAVAGYLVLRKSLAGQKN
jgi:Na+:H+ antiporter, NhaA family